MPEITRVAHVSSEQSASTHFNYSVPLCTTARGYTLKEKNGEESEKLHENSLNPPLNHVMHNFIPYLLPFSLSFFSSISYEKIAI